MADFEARRSCRQTKKTLSYLLEAFVNHPDFHETGHWMIQEGVVYSPSAIAAYLQHCVGWDETAELYLHHIVTTSHDAGGVPSSQAPTYAELTSVRDTSI